MTLRITREASEALSKSTGNARVSRQVVEALISGVGGVRATRETDEVLSSTPGAARASRQMYESLVTYAGYVYVTRQSGEVLSHTGAGAKISRQMMEALVLAPSALCVSRQSTEVLTRPTGPARVSRQLVEALTNVVFIDSAPDSLALSELYSVLKVSPNTASTVTRVCAEVWGQPVAGVALTRQMVEVLGWPTLKIWSCNTSDTLSLTDSNVFVPETTANTGDSLILSESQSFSSVRVKAASDSLTLSEVTALTRVANVHFSDSLTLSEVTVLAHIFNLKATDAISLSDQEKSIGPRLISTADLLTLSETLYRPVIAQVTTSDTVAFADSCRSSLAVEALTDSLVLSESFDTHVKGRTNSDSLAITDKFDCSGWVATSDSLSLTETFTLRHVTVATTDRITFSEALRQTTPVLAYKDTLALVDTARSNARSVGYSDVVFLVETPAFKAPGQLGCSDALQTITDTLDPTTLATIETISGLQDTYSVVKLSVQSQVDNLQLSESFGGYILKASAKSIAFSDTLPLSEGVYRNKTGSFPDFLTFSDNFAAATCKWLSDSLGFGEQFGLVRRTSQQYGDTLTWTESFLSARSDADTLYRYSPAGALPSLDGPLAVTTRFQLLYPATSTVTDSVTLRRMPNLGNKDRLGFNRVLRETRGGTLIVFADPIWPKTQTLVLNFSSLLRSETQQLLSFFENHLGVEVGLMDWEHRYWRGIIMTPESPVIEDTRGRFSASFSFEGELDPATGILLET
jgi:hypothetical protein